MAVMMMMALLGIILLPVASLHLPVARRAPVMRMLAAEEPSVATNAKNIDVSSAADAVKVLKDTPSTMMDHTFTRAGDFFGTGPKVTAQEIANVLGRWRAYEQWESVGVLTEMDQLFDSEGNVVDGPALKRAWARWDEAFITSKSTTTKKKMLKVKGLPDYRASHLPTWMAAGNDPKPKRDPLFGEYLGKENERLSGTDPTAARSAARRGFCLRRGQAQRWWHNENLCQSLLPFESEAMAASVGATAAELDATAPTWEACDVVFDALSRSQSGLVDKSLINERRAMYETADGAFDANAFAAELADARKNILVSLAIFPGSLNLIFLVAFLEADGVSATLAAYDNMLRTVDANMAIWGAMLGGGGA